MPPGVTDGPEPEMTVVVCTHNRAHLLATHLVPVLRQATDKVYEVVVVDNASEDGTVDVVLSLCREHPHLRLAQEPALGVSRARNRGLAEARAPIVAFTDDDCIPEADWVEALLEAFRRPEVGAAGGRIRVGWPAGEPPPWVPDRYLGYWGALDLGEAPGALGPGATPYGGNLAVRRAVALDLGGFDPELGFRGATLMGSEDVDLMERLRRAGWEVHWQPAAQVTNRLAAERTTRRYLLRRLYGQGQTDRLRGRPAPPLGLGPQSLARALRRPAGPHAMRLLLRVARRVGYERARPRR